MRRPARIAWLVALTALAWLASAGTALADNCGDPRDCYATDSAATRAGQGLLALLLLYLLLQLLGRGSGAGWGWPGGGRDGFGGEGEGGGTEGFGAGGVGGGSLTDRLLGWLDNAFGSGGTTLLGGRVGETEELLSGELLGAAGSLTVRGEGIAELVSEGGLQLDESGLAAQLGLQATVGAEFGIQGSLSSGWITQSLEGTLFTGATAGATGGLQLGAEGLGLHGEAEAFVGGKASGAYTLETGAVTSTVGGSVSYGLGYKAEGDVSFGWNKIGFSGEAGGTLGFGAEADINVSVNPGAVVDGMQQALDWFGW